MNLRNVLLVLVLTLAVGCAKIRHDDSSSKSARISPNDAPADVTTAFYKAYPGAKVKKLNKETYKDGTVHYEFTFKDSKGKKQTVEYSAGGERLEKH